MDASGRGIHASSGCRVSPAPWTMKYAIPLRHTSEDTAMGRTTITPFHAPSTAVAFMRVGFGTWMTQVMVAKGLADIPLQWSRLVTT
jgi:hypothetical protein